MHALIHIQCVEIILPKNIFVVSALYFCLNFIFPEDWFFNLLIVTLHFLPNFLKPLPFSDWYHSIFLFVQIYRSLKFEHFLSFTTYTWTLFMISYHVQAGLIAPNKPAFYFIFIVIKLKLQPFSRITKYHRQQVRCFISNIFLVI